MEKCLGCSAELVLSLKNQSINPAWRDPKIFKIIFGHIFHVVSENHFIGRTLIRGSSSLPGYFLKEFSRWSFGPNATWGSIETAIIGKRASQWGAFPPTLLLMWHSDHRPSLYCSGKKISAQNYFLAPLSRSLTWMCPRLGLQGKKCDACSLPVREIKWNDKSNQRYEK